MRVRKPTARRTPVGLLPGRLVLYAWLLASVPMAALQLAHVGIHERVELPPLLHWLRDTGLAVPAAAAAVAVAALVVARARGADAGRPTPVTALAWGFLAATIFAVASVPGAELHATLFGAETPGSTSELEHLATEAGLALQTGLLVLVPVALVAGVPWRDEPRPARAADPGPAPVPGLVLGGGDR
jgi:hypothetical protein